MSACHNSPDKLDRLRRQAEGCIRREKTLGDTPMDDNLTLIQDLRDRQAELEIQNEELRRAQHESADLHNQYERLYDFAPCGYITLDPRGITTRVNQAGASMLGISGQSLLQSAMANSLATDWHDAFREALRNAVVTGERQSLKLKLKKGKGLSPWARADITADRDDSGAVLQWFVALFGIDQEKDEGSAVRRQSEEEKRQLKNRLHDAQKMESIGALAGSVANDFNNMLTIIIGNYELMKDDLPIGSPLADNLEEIRLAATRGRGMVRQLLAFARRGDTRQIALDINAVINESLTLVRSTLPANVLVQSHLPAGIDPVFGNRTQINQLMMKLYANATDAMMPAGGTLTVELSNVTLDADEAGRHGHLQPGAYIKLVVADTGCGMDATTREQVFEPYFTTKPSGKGTGIGLAMVHGIVEQHHGHISVESQANQGTVFTILFPACTGQVANENVRKPDLPQGNERILLVDDEAAIAKLGRVLLGRMGYAVVDVIDPREALEKVQADPSAFDLVITDMAMPHMTGDVLAKKILELRPDMPILLCTGFSEILDKKMARRVGIAGFLMKPMDKTEIAMAVRKTLDRAKAGD